ncbi:putative dienelactone hydrolase [Actinoplanes campanulatus]|uniref:Putative dienelactone hydrolase n=1 Tax=Actinoplanes campanulatus TaxID=113559 RepID=A0A7W5AFU9_9ACTN|nr:hydrolase [Actinoplanes campanulatus]MBB3095552.1 putative dienelactone hydrolase [Actinoplanes campanulatus]GGN09792.1 lipase [Actinoplanes campanulatus]GID36442.1 lipase [Actinoplanes campanulatus]
MLKTLLAAVLAVTPMALPPPTGAALIGTVSVHLVDRSRPDPWVAGEPARELMAQIWYPARSVRGHRRADWVSPGVAARINPPDSGYALPVTHGYVGAPPARGWHPVILYSPGLGMERTAGTALVEDLVSHGYVVVTIDHTHDANLVEFPDGRLAEAAIPPPASPEEERALLDKILGVRVADTRFVLDELRGLPLAKAMDLSRVGMFGHSMGGAATAQTMAADRRVRAGINLDGTFLGPVEETGLDRPFLMLGSDTHGDEQDETWVRMWDRLRGARYWLELEGSAHLSFSDFQVLLHQAGLPAEQTEPMIGAIDGERSVAVQRAYVRAFFDRHLRHRDGRLLDRPSPRYPEINHLP